MRQIGRVIELISKRIGWIAGFSLVVMMLITCSEVTWRYMGPHSIKGSFELVAQLLILVIWLSIAFTETERGHITIDVLFERFPQRIKVIAEVISYLLCLGIFSLITWQCVVLGMTFSSHHQVTESLKWPLAPFVYGGILGLVLMCMLLLVQLYNALVQMIRK